MLFEALLHIANDIGPGTHHDVRIYAGSDLFQMVVSGGLAFVDVGEWQGMPGPEELGQALYYLRQAVGDSQSDYEIDFSASADNFQPRFPDPQELCAIIEAIHASAELL